MSPFMLSNVHTFALFILHIIVLIGIPPSLLCFMVKICTLYFHLHRYRLQFNLCTTDFRFTLPTPQIHHMDTNFLVTRRYNLEITIQHIPQYSPPTEIPMARCSAGSGVDPLPERLEGDLQGGTRVWNLKFLEN